MKACQDAVRASAEWAAELIRQDWKGPSREERTYDRREYYPARRPVVLEYFGQTLQAVGGRFPKVTWDEEDNQSVWPTEMPDYICLIEGDHAKYVDWYLANGGMIAARQTFNGLPFIFCKRAERECVHAVPTENERAAGRCITGGK